MIVIDKLSYSSKLRFLDPCMKSLFAITTLLVCVASRSITIALITLLVMGGATCFLGGISYAYLVKLLCLPLAFLILSTLAIIVNYSPYPLSWFALPLRNHYLTISGSSLLHGMQLIITALASVSCLYFLSLSTPLTDLLYVLERIHCPALLIELMLLIYRFIFILLEIAESLTIAQRSRLGNRTFKTACISIGRLMSVLFLRAFQKSAALYDAMESRCYDGTIHVLKNTYIHNKKYYLYIVLFEAVLIFLAILLHYTTP